MRAICGSVSLFLSREHRMKSNESNDQLDGGKPIATTRGNRGKFTRKAGRRAALNTTARDPRVHLSRDNSDSVLR